ncbi:MAG: alpha-N-arabinofuranosidase [Alphaproteobacteria bacterium]|nr:alpha-N-arabinofuranosidase [Alphaproteobacteria bacterium]
MKNLKLLGLVALLSAALPAAAAPAPQPAATTLTIHADRPGAVINKDVYGQFSEHLGSGIYGGIYVGKDSPIPNTDGFRNDVIAALKDLHVPVVRWPGGCFADEYHWRDGIGPQAQRPVRVNHNWGGVPETNAFGTHEYFEFLDLIGADAYVSLNVGSGSVQEAMDWIEYMTSDQDTTLARLRKANGRDKPWKLAMLGVGNETWGCGGSMTAAYYTDLFKQYATFVRTKPEARPQVIASGDHDTTTDFTESLMKNARGGLDAIDFHYYTILGPQWENKDTATGFGEAGWINMLANTLKMDGFIRQHIAIMDKYEALHRQGPGPHKKVGLYIDEWGSWYQPEPGSNPGFLVQQNTIRDAVLAAANFNIFHKYADRVRMTAIAQTVNVLQAMILTDGPKMLKTPTYWVYDMYQPFQEATSLPLDLKTGTYKYGKWSVPQVSASAARASDGSIVVGLANLDPHRPAQVSAVIAGAHEGQVKGRLLTGDTMDAHNTFENPDAVHPVAFDSARLSGNSLSVTLPPKSVVVLSLR